MKCPGQDTRYWKPEDVYELTCAQCGRPVEFFKTDGRRSCPGCGSRIENPNVSLGCAQWCEHAIACLGYDPKTVRLKPSADTPLVKKLTDAVRAGLRGDGTRIDHALAVLTHARAILAVEGGRPRVVIAAALLCDVDVREARRILEEVGVDPVTITHVCDIVADAAEVDTLESRIVRDARALVNLTAAGVGRGDAERTAPVDETFSTAAGKTRAPEQLVKKDVPET